MENQRTHPAEMWGGFSLSFELRKNFCIFVRKNTFAVLI